MSKEKIYKATALLSNTYATQIQGQSNIVSNWLIHKIKHSFCVAHDIMDIFFAEQGLFNSFSESEREMVEVAGILHDLGRFYQHRDGRILENSEFHHGKEAVKLLRDNPDFNNPILLFAIEEHCNFSVNYNNPLFTKLSTHDKHIAEAIAQLLRDADKLENIKDFTYNGMAHFHNVINGPISKDAHKYILEKQTLARSVIKTTSDRILCGLSWVNDIYFESTRKQIRAIKYLERGIEMMHKFGATDEDCKFVRENLTV